jgi:hypothetical protein
MILPQRAKRWGLVLRIEIWEKGEKFFHFPKMKKLKVL